MIRQVTGEAGSVAMAFDLALRFDYGSIPPWLRAEPRVVRGVVGPDLVVLALADRCRLHATIASSPSSPWGPARR